MWSEGLYKARPWCANSEDTRLGVVGVDGTQITHPEHVRMRTVDTARAGFRRVDGIGRIQSLGKGCHVRTQHYTAKGECLGALPDSPTSCRLPNMVNMRTTLSIASLCLGVAVQAQDIIPVTQTVQFTAAAVATGSSFATLVPFNVDYTAQLDYRNSSVLDKYSTSVWQSRVDIYDDSESFNSFVSLQWPNGQGPSPAPVGISKDWRACVVAIPDLFDRLGVTNSGNGSCFDVINDYCLYNMMISASAIWESTIRQTTSLNDTVAAKACSNINSLPLAPGCFGKSSQETGEIRGAYLYHVVDEHWVHERDADISSSSLCQPEPTKRPALHPWSQRVQVWW